MWPDPVETMGLADAKMGRILMAGKSLPDVGAFAFKIVPQEEASMPAANAREILNKENELLDDLIARATIYAQNNDGVMAEIANGWAEGLARHRQVNLKLIHDSDAAFDESVNEEIELLSHLVGTIEKKGVVTSSWLDHFNDDIGFLKELL